MRVLPPADLAIAARAVEAGALIVAPTARWYMLCCDASNADACARIYRAKRRPEHKALLLLLPRKENAANYFSISSAAQALIAQFWPGDLALLLRWLDPALGRTYAAAGPDIALVGNESGLIGQLAAQTSTLICATSANISGGLASEGHGPAITVEEVLAFAERSTTNIALVIDGGICPQSQHMTVVDCSALDAAPKIVREGVVHRRAVAAALGSLGVASDQ